MRTFLILGVIGIAIAVLFVVPHYQQFKTDNQCIGAWTLEEYSKLWEKMPSLKNGWEGGGYWSRNLTNEEVQFLNSGGKSK